MSGYRFANALMAVFVTVAVGGMAFAQEPATNESSFPTLKGPYVGQTPPGPQPQLFAEGIIPVDAMEHCFPTFSPDGREVYWMTMVRGSRPKIMCMREVDGKWTPPEVASFSGEYPDMAPAFSPDGSRLYFASARPGGLGKADIWYMDRTDSGWSAPINPGAPLNSAESESQPTATNDGTVYFVGPLADVKWGRGIYRAEFVDGQFTDPVVLPAVINSEHAESYPFIAPDESYLLFGSTRPGGRSVETDAYVSFRGADGSWAEPVHLGEEINNGKTVTFPCVTADGKYMFIGRFNDSGTDAFYWMDASVLEQFKPKAAEEQ